MPRVGGLHGGLSLTRCGPTVTTDSSDSPGGWLRTSKTLLSDWAANSAVSAAARLTCCAARLALSLSFSSLHALCPHAFRARYPPSARAWSLTTCVHASVPTTSTSAPCTALAWMKTTSPEGALPKPKPLSTNHLSTVSFTTLVWSARASSRLASRSSSSSWELSLSSLSSLQAATSVLTSSFRSQCTRNSTIRRISRSSLAHSWSIVAWVCEPPAPTFGATWTNSLPGPCASVSSSSHPQSPPWTRLVASACCLSSSSSPLLKAVIFFVGFFLPLFFTSVHPSVLPSPVSSPPSSLETMLTQKARLRGWQDQVLEPLVIRLDIKIELFPTLKARLGFHGKSPLLRPQKHLGLLRLNVECFPLHDRGIIHHSVDKLHTWYLDNLLDSLDQGDLSVCPGNGLQSNPASSRRVPPYLRQVLYQTRGAS